MEKSAAVVGLRGSVATWRRGACPCFAAVGRCEASFHCKWSAAPSHAVVVTGLAPSAFGFDCEASWFEALLGCGGYTSDELRN